MLLSLVCLSLLICMQYSPLGNPGLREKNDQPAGPIEDPVVKEIAEKHNITPAQVSVNS